MPAPRPTPGSSAPEQLARALERAFADRLTLALAMLAYCRTLAELPPEAAEALALLHPDGAEALATGQALRDLKDAELRALAAALTRPTDHAEIRHRVPDALPPPGDEALEAVKTLVAALIGPPAPRRRESPA